MKLSKKGLPRAMFRWAATSLEHRQDKNSDWRTIQALNIAQCQSTPSQTGVSPALLSIALLLQQETLFIPVFIYIAYIFSKIKSSQCFLDRNKYMLLGFNKLVWVDLFLNKELKPKGKVCCSWRPRISERIVFKIFMPAINHLFNNQIWAAFS